MGVAYIVPVNSIFSQGVTLLWHVSGQLKFEVRFFHPKLNFEFSFELKIEIREGKGILYPKIVVRSNGGYRRTLQIHGLDFKGSLSSLLYKRFYPLLISILPNFLSLKFYYVLYLSKFWSFKIVRSISLHRALTGHHLLLMASDATCEETNFVLPFPPKDTKPIC